LREKFGYTPLPGTSDFDLDLGPRPPRARGVSACPCIHQFRGELLDQMVEVKGINNKQDVQNQIRCGALRYVGDEWHPVSSSSFS